MTRPLHRWLGLTLALFLTVTALSGAALSFFPAAEAWWAPSTGGMTIADLAARVARAHPGVQEIKASPSGRVTAYYPENGATVSSVIDPATGARIAPAATSRLELWLIDLHRSLFLGDRGRMAAAALAGGMMLMAVSGFVLLARRSGGWRRILAPTKGSGAGRWHARVSRLAVAGLALSSITALWMTASTFNLLPTSALPLFPAGASGTAGMDIARIPALAGAPAGSLRDLTFPAAGDATDVYTLTTTNGQGYLDQGTGKTLAWVAPGLADRITETVRMLHTGQGASLLGLLLGLSALSVPFLGFTGLMQSRKGSARRQRSGVAVGHADTIILVGSEGGTTWGFAETLRAALDAAGKPAHVTSLADFRPDRWTRATGCIILASTYGEGEAPADAAGFLDALLEMPVPPAVPLAILGFGDRSFPAFCGYADRIGEVADQIGWAALIPMATVDRQSSQDFARWGRDLSAALGLDFELEHTAERVPTTGLTLIERRDYGEAVQAPMAILRFALPKRNLWQRITGRGMGGFAAGDILGVLPEGSAVARFYSLASSSRDGFLEICVRKHHGGLCSGQLIALEPGDQVQAFLRHNPSFHPDRSDAPLILVGAGTGIGPLAGFIRANRSARPIHLFFGMRHADSDFLYREDLEDWTDDGRLSGMRLAYSRGPRPHYVQDALLREEASVMNLLAAGARIMVCGGRDMAAGVKAVLGDILAPLGLTFADLVAEGRYAEDVY